MLVDEFPYIVESISCTTRPIRPGEIADKDYHFLSKATFEEKIRAGELLEYAQVFGHYYGTSKIDVDKHLKAGKHVLLVIDTQGAMELKAKKYPAVYIFIRPPSMGELRARLFQRKTEREHHIEERLSWAEKEMEHAPAYDYIIMNDNLHRAYDILRSILISEEHKTERYHDRHVDE
jgi:guanylate kinase